MRRRRGGWRALTTAQKARAPSMSTGSLPALLAKKANGMDASPAKAGVMALR